MNPDAAPNPAPIAAGRDGSEDVAAEDETVAVVLQTSALLVVASNTGFGMERVAEALFERAVILEIDIGVSMTAAGTKGVPKLKFVKF